VKLEGQRLERLWDLIIKTASGSKYEIIDGVCRKYDPEGHLIDSFKPVELKGVRKDIQNLKDLRDARKFKPAIGKRLYVTSLNGWWLSTEIVEIID